MATPTQIYVDPAINANSGAGTIGSPYGDLQHALNTVTRNATDGDQFNVKAGTSEILAAALTLATYGTPTATAPLIIRGYTAAANDGGQGVVSGNGSLAIFTGNPAFTNLVDMRFTNCGAAAILTISTSGLILNCEIDTSTGSGIVSGSPVIGCYIHNTGVSGVSNSMRVMFCTFRNETNSFTQAINMSADDAVAMFNIIDIGGASHGIAMAANGFIALFNSIYSNGGTGTGLRNNTTTNVRGIIFNNTVVGFSGAGGTGLLVAGQNANMVGYNLLYNNTTNVSITGDVNADLGNNDVSGSIPFVDAPNDDFDAIAGLSVGYPTTWKSYTATQQNLLRMAAQYAAAAGGGLMVHPGTSGRMNG